jgi:hypothetical protein
MMVMHRHMAGIFGGIFEWKFFAAKGMATGVIRFRWYPDVSGNSAACRT